MAGFHLALIDDPRLVVGGIQHILRVLLEPAPAHADAIVLFDPAAAELVRWRRKRGGHLQSKGRFLAAQVLALVADGLWLNNARAANAAAAEIASAAEDRLLYPAEANELFVKLSAQERAALREQGFQFYDWDDAVVRMVTAWDTPQEHALALAKALAAL